MVLATNDTSADWEVVDIQSGDVKAGDPVYTLRRK
jgi:hypothetical protein